LVRALPQTLLRGAYIALLDPLDGFKGPTCKGRRVGKRRGRKGPKGRTRKGVRAGEGTWRGEGVDIV